MSSPIGHSLVGLGSFLLIRHNSNFSKNFSAKTLLITGIIFANLPDIDFILGYLIYQNFGQLHRQFTHSFSVGLLMSILIGAWMIRKKNISYKFMLWLLALYYSHILLDMLSYDSNLPAGVQCFFPFDNSHFTFPITILGGLTAENGIWHLSNVITIIQEIIVLPLLFFIIVFCRKFIKNKLKFHGQNKH